VTPERLRALLEAVAAGASSPAEALERLAWLPVEEVGDGTAAPYARIDHHRELRLGFPEVVFCQNKTPDQTVEICRRLADRAGAFLATRADAATQHALSAAFPGAEVNAIARTVCLAAPDAAPLRATAPVVVLSAGTSDLPVAEEAAVTARAFGHDVVRLHDVGVAGLHRILGHGAQLQHGVLIVVAGMEGALPSVVGGLTGMPIVAVPTSVGYGASFGGLAALLAMLNSCAAGITVVNIDNGFGAACAATRILRLLASRA
jgi:pyridinium-3,5-biscarboxylic acid mononucleotide synthase